MKEQGKIKTILPVESGTSKDGKEWKKVVFVIANNGGYEGREQIFAFEIFGAEKVNKFLQFNKVGDTVDVGFNITTNEYKGKYYTSLGAWKVFKAGVNTPQGSQTNQAPQTSADDLDFLND